ncbi:MAG: hypothetical protein H0V70_09905 [Ktedonobacteraceae bacterium]|nr:hypothetical protein [Ktedonobacteraceae bacterium]
MKQFPDPQDFFVQHLEQAAEKRIRGMKRAGITRPSWKLVNRLIERDIEEGKERYIEENNKVLEHNIKVHIRSYRRRNRQINREGAQLALWTCPPVIALFSFMAWYSFNHPGVEGLLMGAMYSIGALAFLGMLIATQILTRRR